MKTDHPSAASRAGYVQDVFERIAPRYDLMNRLMTAGQDVRWRQYVIRRAAPRSGDAVLDLGAGTGDLAREALRQCSTCRVTAADFTLGMMQAGRHLAPRAITWACADALHLPFPDGCFDVLVSGYLLRNVTDLERALAEQNRVLRPGGRWVSLDTTRPGSSLLSPLIHFHMHSVIPFAGSLITGQRDAYTYLPDSTEAFLSAEDLSRRLSEAGFSRVGFERRMFGTMAIHWGEKL